jgi:hypothetical protein
MVVVKTPPFLTAAGLGPELLVGCGLEAGEASASDYVRTVSTPEKNSDVTANVTVFSEDCPSIISGFGNGFELHTPDHLQRAGGNQSMCWRKMT